MKVVKTSLEYYIGRYVSRVWGSLAWGLTIEGQENIPKAGGVLIAPNHTSMFDPPLIGASMKRPLHFMAKQELFQIPVLGFIIKRTNAFPVKRGMRDVGAFRNTQRLLEAGEAVLVFPEGSRTKDGSLGKPLSGVGMLACMAQVPVVPVRLRNTGNPSRANPVKVVFGKPIYPPVDFNKETYQKISEEVMEAINKL